MGKETGIEWTDHTFNPWWGCLKVSPGCEHCYADTLATRYGHKIWGPAKTTPRRLFGDKHWAEPLKWNAAAAADGLRRRVFCASMADVFEAHPQVTDARDRLFDLIAQTPALDWLLLTKRPENILHMIPFEWAQTAPANVWYGTSTENQEQADTRIPELLKVPGVVHFLSAEPLIGPVDLSQWMGYLVEDDDGAPYPGAISWVIAGGESGPGARPMHPDWARSLRDQCQAGGVAFFMKQWGEHWPAGHRIVEGRSMVLVGDEAMYRVGKKRAGRELDGRTWDEFPEVAHAR